MLRAIKIRLYPNKGQELKLNKVLGCYRFVYNQMLALKQQEYNENKKSLGLTDLSKYFHGTLLKDEQYEWLKEQNTKVMKQSIRQMLSAYDKFFKQHNGFPKFKSKKDKQSALFPLEAISKGNKFNERKITLTQPLKDIRFRCSDLYFKKLQTYKEGIRSATLSKTKSGNYFLFSVVNELLTYYDTVFMEDLNVQGMLKNHKLAKAIQEVGFYRFKQVLEDKARNNYKEVVFVGRFYPSSKTCHKCGYVNKELTLNDREWTCPLCGEHHDRDLNAAINILMEGERIIGVRSTEFTLVEKPTVDDRTLCS